MGQRYVILAMNRNSEWQVEYVSDGLQTEANLTYMCREWRSMHPHSEAHWVTYEDAQERYAEELEGHEARDRFANGEDAGEDEHDRD